MDYVEYVAELARLSILECATMDVNRVQTKTSIYSSLGDQCFANLVLECAIAHRPGTFEKSDGSYRAAVMSEAVRVVSIAVDDSDILRANVLFLQRENGVLIQRVRTEYENDELSSLAIAIAKWMAIGEPGKAPRMGYDCTSEVNY